MNVFYHKVGMFGSDRDFPKTVFRQVNLATVKSATEGHPYQQPLLNALRAAFPDGVFNVWGVPAGARKKMRDLKVGDSVLLMRSVIIQALAKVEVYIQAEFPALSEALWGESKFTWVFFFRTQRLYLPWKVLNAPLKYSSNYHPRSAIVYSIRQDRLDNLGGSKAFVRSLVERYAVEQQDAADDSLASVPAENISLFNQAIANTEIQHLDGDERAETLMQTIEVLNTDLDAPPVEQTTRQRSERISRRSKRHSGFRVAVCEVYDWTCAVCGSSLSSPSGRHEVEAAHIRSVANDGPDDVRNGLCLCRLHHWAFDTGCFTITEEMRILVHPAADETFRALHDRKLRRPSLKKAAPAECFVDFHRTQFIKALEGD